MGSIKFITQLYG